MQKATNLWRICLSTLLFVALGLGSKEFLTHFKPITVSANSHNYQFQNVVIGGGGGFVPGIIFSTRQPNLMYARTDIGGAYRWDPATSSWIPLLDWIGSNDRNLSGVESIAADPIDARGLSCRGHLYQ